MYHYSRGRCFICDATCVNTFVSSNIIRATLAAGFVADAAEVRNIAKYAEFGRRFIYQPVAVETSGAMEESTIQFFKDFGHRLACDFRVSARVISCSSECLWLFSGGTPSAFCSRTVISHQQQLPCWSQRIDRAPPLQERNVAYCWRY